jgi:prevent-host-death family protein
MRRHLDKRTSNRTLQRVKTIGVTDLRQRTAEILSELKASDEPIAILQRSQPTAYLVSAEQFEADRIELRAARRALFLREVRESEAEYQAGASTSYVDVDALLDDLRG